MKMKIIYKLTIILFAFLSISSCSEEQLINPDPSFILSFQREGQAKALAGTVFYVIPDGLGEFLTLYDGTDGHIWDEPGARGVDFNGADSLGIIYKTSGTYTLTLVASSTGNFGNEFSRQVKTVEVTVIDQRNSFKSFKINDIDGQFTPSNEILFSVPDVVTNFKFAAKFTLDSDAANVLVNGTKQISGETINDFEKPVTYTVKSANGEENTYNIKFSTFPSSSGKEITKFALGKGGYNELGTIDEATRTITLKANYATNLEAVKLVIESVYDSEIFINNTLYSSKENYNLSSNQSLKVVAQDKSETSYSIDVITDSPVSSFTFTGLVPEPAGRINESSKTITVDVLKETNLYQLKATWTGSLGKVTVAGTTQENGVTQNDFSKPVVYTFYKGNNKGDEYTVTVNLK
jgi:hypothetical protein